jgi:sec-independent protein translocase protein TatB
MPQIGPLEVLAVAAIALIVFGPDKLPEIARSVGRTLSQLRRMADEVRDEFKDGLDFDSDEDQDDRKAPAPRADHPNVRAEAEAKADEPAVEEEPEEEFDPNHDIPESRDETMPGEGPAPTETPALEDAAGAELDAETEPPGPESAGEPATTEPRPEANVQSAPKAGSDRPPEQRAG